MELTSEGMELVRLMPDDSGIPVVRLFDLIDEASSDARRRFEAHRDGTPLGPVSGIPTLDRRLGGSLEPGIHVLHGAPGTGKSALALQMAVKCGCPSLLVTMEMRPIVLLKRLAAATTGTYLGKFATGEMDPRFAAQQYEAAARAGANLGIIDATRHVPSLDDLYIAAVAVRATAAHLLVVIDSLHSYADRIGADVTEYERLNAALAGLTQLSSHMACPVLVVCERNRSSSNTGGLSAAAGTRKIEYSAETVMDLDLVTDDTGKPLPKETHNGEEYRAVTVKLSKNRNGEARGKAVSLLFSGAMQRFEEPES